MFVVVVMLHCSKQSHNFQHNNRTNMTYTQSKSKSKSKTNNENTKSEKETNENKRTATIQRQKEKSMKWRLNETIMELTIIRTTESNNFSFEYLNNKFYSFQAAISCVKYTNNITNHTITWSICITFPRRKKNSLESKIYFALNSVAWTNDSQIVECIHEYCSKQIVQQYLSSPISWKP